ncbi:hypothetical protein LRS06_03845 [Hymenobacter sp. J193]|nr:hypothetical protein [Hymenobacter sp. J193]
MARPLLIPTRIGTSTNWKQVSAGGEYTVAIQQDGSLWLWGEGPMSDRPLPAPTRVGTSTNWQSISTSASHIVGIHKDGTLWAWGGNFHGALGDGTQIGRKIPKRIGDASDWVYANVGWMSTVAIRRDGSLWAWGFINNPKELNTPQRIGQEIGWKCAALTAENNIRLVAVRQNGSLWQYERTTIEKPKPVMVQVEEETNWQWVTAGNTHVLGTRTDGTFWAWGDNEFGQVGSPALRTNYQPLPVPLHPATTWVAIEAGREFSLGLQQDGSLWGWGGSSGGSLGFMAFKDISVPTRIAAGSTWKNISAGFEHLNAGIQQDGALYTWGTHSIFHEPATTSLVDTTDAEGGAQTILVATGTAMRYDRDDLLPKRIGKSSEWQSVSAGAEHLAVIRQDGTLWTWGSNERGQLGTGAGAKTTNSLVQVGTASDWKQISAGYAYTAGIRQDSSLWVWGSVPSSRENDPFNLINLPTPMGGKAKWQWVEAGHSTLYALRADGSLWALGDNQFGQLGDGTSEGKSALTRIGTATDWQSLAPGSRGVTALRTDGSLWAWGLQENSLLGPETYGFQQQPTRIEQPTGWHTLAAGSNHTLAIRRDGTLWGWGENKKAQLGTPDTRPLHSETPLLVQLRQ